MSEVVLQTIVEKLVAIEIALLKDTNPVKEETIHALLKEITLFKSEMAKLPLEFEKGTEKSSELLQSITALIFKLDNPIEGKIKDCHHFHKGIWIAIFLFIFCCIFLYGWISCSYTKKAFEANDVKYRYLKVYGNSNLLKAIYSTDSLYNLDKDYFGEKVIEKEKNFVNEYELYRIANEKKKESKSGKDFKPRKVREGR